MYDMSGNLWEWCEDDYHSNYTGAPTNGSAWVDSSPYGRVRRSLGSGLRMLRGGSSGGLGVVRDCRSARREGNWVDSQHSGFTGFRLALPAVR